MSRDPGQPARTRSPMRKGLGRRFRELPVSRRQALRFGAAAGATLALSAGMGSALLRRARLHRVSDTRTRMGTLVNVTVLHPAAAAARALVSMAFAEIDRLEAVFSTHRPDTPLAHLNRDGVLDRPPPELVAVIKRALHYAQLTAGAFDVTVSPLVELYRASFAESGVPPHAAAVEAALDRVGYHRIEAAAHRIVLHGEGTKVSLDGIAKGYILDRVVTLLEDAGAVGGLADGGGDIAAGEGETAGRGWPVGVGHPRESGAVATVIEVRNQGVATSGDYMRAYTRDHRFHHVVDPRTGISPGRVSAVTVVAPSAMDADALATAVLVLGPVDGAALLERLERAEGLLFTKEGNVLQSSGFNI